MIIAQVLFPQSEPMALETATGIFQSTAKRYEGRAGLLRKHYMRAEDGMFAGAIYLWESREAAEATYTDEWRAMVTEKYGAPAQIRFFDAPVTVDNT